MSKNNTTVFIHKNNKKKQGQEEGFRGGVAEITSVIC